VAIFLYVLQIHRRDAADQVRQAQELEAGVRHAGNDLDNLANDHYSHNYISLMKAEKRNVLAAASIKMH